MPMELKDVLDAIETDISADVGSRFVGTAARYLRGSRAAERPVSTWKKPDELWELFNQTLPSKGTSIEDVLERVERDVVYESNWLYHPRYMGHQVSAPLPAAIWTEPIIGALNQSLAVQEMSPALTMIEMRLIRWFCEAAGFPAGSGTLTSGGTEATFTALAAARAALMPDAWEDGLSGTLPVVLCGEHAHYAVTRAVAQLGLGLKRAIPIPSVGHRMDTAKLGEKLKELQGAGTPIMAVVATAGSTATGSFDDLHAVADVCEENQAWMHVDGAHGASALLSQARRRSVAGIERARSIAWDPHKMMLMPLSVGVLLMRDPADLEAAFRQKAPYLFHSAATERSWDQGGRSFQCSRRADALKLWVAVNRYGTEAFGVLYDHLCALTEHLHDRLQAHPDFEVLHEPECNILCFRFRAEIDEDHLNFLVRSTYNTAGTGWITTTLLDGLRVLRVTLMNPRTTTAHLDEMVNELAKTGWQLRS